MKQLDPTQQRVLGVLIEKELTVPDSYPLTENSLVLGCNQKSNRDPLTSLSDFEVSGTLMGLQLDGWVGRSERDGGRTVRYKHLVESKLGIDAQKKSLLCELLVRGPQTTRELKVRIERMAVHVDEAAVEAMLRSLTSKDGIMLVELLPKAPRERDPRWAHRLGPRGAADHAAPVEHETRSSVVRSPLEERLAALEARVAALEARDTSAPSS